MAVLWFGVLFVLSFFSFLNSNNHSRSFWGTGYRHDGFLGPLLRHKVFFVLYQDLFQSKYVEHTIPLSLVCVTQTFVNFISEDAKHLPLHFVIREQQREEILVLGQTFDEGIIDIIKIGELKIFLGVVLGTGL